MRLDRLDELPDFRGRGKQTHRPEKTHPAISGDQFTSKRPVTNRDKIGVRLCAFSFSDDAKTPAKRANHDIFGGFNSHRLHHFSTEKWCPEQGSGSARVEGRNAASFAD
jgi:hypothetical protein